MFFVEPYQIKEDSIIITGSDVNHIKNVLRMQLGDKITVSNSIDGKVYEGEMIQMGEEILCKLCSVSESSAELSAQVYLFQCLPKGDKMEFIIQKAVELGVREIIPVASKRCVVKLDAKKEAAKIKRWQGIAEAAAKQSRRLLIPRVNRVMTVSEALAYGKEMDVKLMPYELAEGMNKTKELIENIKENQKIAVFIGPEGGFEENEVEKALEGNFEAITLGNRILRTETAGLTVLAWIMYHLE
ncbi:16S rRNA (uracil(1498)-N(3))-methyltransferase [Lachnospiraceae bacterium OttesenSCG-928-D06]|nr:16S rRNA (uracil(1498)-N(3))-methyltransferase [Lachnospiraceae bacterium OttesenSCG-928-D06]